MLSLSIRARSVFFFTLVTGVFLGFGSAMAAPSLSVSSNSVLPNTLITVNLKQGDGYENDWIGLFKTGADNKTYISRVSIPKGQTTYSWKTIISSEGSFEFRLFLKNSYIKTATSQSIISSRPVMAPPSLSLTKVVIDGLETYYRAPQAPTGVIYFFHGSGGSAASFSQQVEAIYFAAAALSGGYWVIFLESTNRTNKAWDPSGSLASNKDLLHIQRVRGYMQNSAGLANNLPEYALGMSNGAGFAPFASYYFNFHAVAVYCASGYSSLFQQADYRIPVFYMAAENDSIVDNTGITSNADFLRSKNIPVEYETNYSEPLLANRFARIKGITLVDSNQIYSSLIKNGYINSDGVFLRSPANLTTDQIGIQFYSQFGAIKDQLLAVYAEHQFTSEFSSQTLNFFRRY